MAESMTDERRAQTRPVVARRPLLLAGALILLGVTGWFLAAKTPLADGLGDVLGSVTRLAEWLSSFGIWAPVVSMLLLTLQTVISPLPGTPLIAANGMIFGLWPGVAVSWIGTLTGAAASFFIARYAGRLWLGREFQSDPLFALQRLSETDGFWIVTVARLTPIVSLDFIGYAAGLSRMRFSRYLLACAIGQTPGVLGYSVLGYDALHTGRMTGRCLLVLVTGLLLFLFGRWYFRRQGIT